jgi:hypothetical protein
MDFYAAIFEVIGLCYYTMSKGSMLTFKKTA